MAAAKKAVKKPEYIYSVFKNEYYGPFNSIQEALNDANEEGLDTAEVYQLIANYKIVASVKFEEVK